MGFLSSAVDDKPWPGSACRRIPADPWGTGSMRPYRSLSISETP
jgi:hypothetical protein